MSPRIVSIIGFPHSGSTLLGDVLGSAPSVMHAGETAVVCDRLLRNERRACSCGTPISHCTVWGPALHAAFTASGLDARSVVEGMRLVRSGGRAPAALVEFYSTLFQVAASTSGAEVLIDSSNWPRYARFLREVAGTNLASLHLVRDPRASLHSRVRGGRRFRLKAASDVRVTLSVMRDAFRWNVWNRQATRISKSVLTTSVVRYEDLVEHPAPVLGRVTSALDLPAIAVDGQRVPRVRDHVIWGSRGATAGVSTLALDDAWRTQSPRTRRALAWALTTPMRRRYGYRSWRH